MTESGASHGPKVHAKKFGWFAYYCWAIGALTLVLNILG